MSKGSTQLKEKKQINCFQSDKDATIKLNKKFFKKTFNNKRIVITH